MLPYWNSFNFKRNYEISPRMKNKILFFEKEGKEREIL